MCLDRSVLSAVLTKHLETHQVKWRPSFLQPCTVHTCTKEQWLPPLDLVHSRWFVSRLQSGSSLYEGRQHATDIRHTTPSRATVATAAQLGVVLRTSVAMAILYPIEDLLLV